MHTYSVVGTAQNVPKTGSAKPPALAHTKFQELNPVSLVTDEYDDGSTVQIVAASFHAMHARLSPAMYGKTPPTAVVCVES